jgi:hemolysin-activating ACP:hemolysin acyltransferase
MPPIILGQYKLFRDSNKKPVGAALWGYLSEDAEKRLKVAGKIAPQDWGNNAQLDQDRGLVANEGGTLWLVELITPFHTKENKHREQMIADLMQTAFKDKSVKMMHINPETNRREEITIAEKKKKETPSEDEAAA